MSEQNRYQYVVSVKTKAIGWWIADDRMMGILDKTPYSRG